MRNLFLVIALAAVGCGPSPSAPMAPAPQASPTSPLYVPARPADLDSVLHRDAGAPEGGTPDAAAADAATDAAATDAGGAGLIPNADAVVASLRGKFRDCYQRGLQADPTMAGRVLISAKVDPDGGVVSSDIASVSGLSNDVASCIASVVKAASFSPPRSGAGASTLQIPVTFKPADHN